MLKALYQTFLDERRFLKNCTAGTIRAYSQAWDAFEPFLEPIRSAEEVRNALKSGVVSLMSDGKRKPSSVNCYLRAMNAFLKWASVEEHFTPPIKSVPLLKAPSKEIPILNETQVERLVQFRPQTTRDCRAHAMAMLVLDTGLRLNECMQLEVRDVDLDNFIVTVQRGKGNKQRKVPISGIGRKILYRFISKEGDPGRRFVFGTANGTAMLQRNADRDLKRIGGKLKLTLRWHLLRHTFGSLFIRNGGNVADLQRIMGHAAITTTMLYVHSQASDFVMAHNALSPLAKAAR